MAIRKMIITGEKESFITRVLIKKVQDAGVNCEFVPWTVDDLSKAVNSVPLIVLSMDIDTLPSEEVLHYLTDVMHEKSIHMITVGEHRDIQYVSDRLPGDLIYSSFSRPVDNTAFVETVTNYYVSKNSGDMKKSILVVDDDPQYLTLVREWLRETYKVSMANSGLQAIKWLANNKVDLILLDHEMPVTTGPQVLGMLRSDPDTKSIPVIFLTGKSDKESVMSVVALRPEGYILKGVQKEELLEKIQQFFILRK